MRASRQTATLAEDTTEKAGDLFARSPYSLDNRWRRTCFRDIVADLSRHHYENCVHYRNILAALNIDPTAPAELAELPFLPVGLFKRFDLLSVPAIDVTRTLTSSGTSRSSRSRIFIDRETSILQMRALSRIVTSFIGERPLPLLIIDAPRASDDEADYGARAVAIQGFQLFGGAGQFRADGAVRPDVGVSRNFCGRCRQDVLISGFTT